MKRHNLLTILITLFLCLMFSLSYGQEKKAKEIKTGEKAPTAVKAPDLVVRDIRCGAGSKLLFTAANIGSGSLPSGWRAVADVFFEGVKMGHIDLASPTSGNLTPPGGTAEYLTAFDITRPLTVQITVDAANSIRESNEANNTRVHKVEPCERVTALADLYVSNFKYEGRDVIFPPDTPHTVRQGESKAVEVSIQNWPGTADAVGDFSVGIYLSSAPASGCRPTPIRLWGATVPGGLRSGDIRRFSLNVTIPTTLAPGDYWMYPMVDDTNRIPERNEDGNCATSVMLRVVAR